MSVKEEYHLNAAVGAFYVCEELLLYVPKDSFKKSEAKLRDDIESFQTEIAEDLKYAMRDYLFLACYGEARHAWSYARKMIEELPRRTNRRKAIDTATPFCPEKSLPKLRELFEEDKNWPGGGFGGSSWAKAAETALGFYKLPTKIFVDNCVDLAHNNGPIFDKGVVFVFMTGYTNWTSILDTKASGSLIHQNKYNHRHYPYTISLVKRAHTLGLLMAGVNKMLLGESPPKDYWGPWVVEYKRYEPVEWGNAVLTDPVDHDPEDVCNGCSKLDENCECDYCEVCDDKGHTDEYHCAECGEYGCSASKHDICKHCGERHCDDPDCDRDTDKERRAMISKQLSWLEEPRGEEEKEETA